VGLSPPYFLNISDGICESAVIRDSTSSLCFPTIESSFNAIPLGRFAPVSHFSTVDSLVFR
jgi:hypothetical protein